MMSVSVILFLLTMVNVSVEAGGYYKASWSYYKTSSVNVPSGNSCSGCSINGVCYSANQQWKQACWTLQCNVRTLGRLSIRQSVPVKTQCRDVFGSCVDNGGTDYRGRCTCEVIGTSYRWTCLVGK